jgi:hypothetical protein
VPSNRIKMVSQQCVATRIYATTTIISTIIME